MARRSPKIEVYDGNRLVPKEEQPAFLAGLNARMERTEQERQIQRRFERAMARRTSSNDRPSIVRQRLWVESQIVNALWTLARLPSERGNGYASRHGVGYIEERADIYANAVENGGWLTVPPKAPPPTAREVDEWEKPLSWMRFLDREQAKLLSTAASTKRGDLDRNINWSRVKQMLPRLVGLDPRTLQRRYEKALTTIVAELTLVIVS
jgi:hypothetical protein